MGNQKYGSLKDFEKFKQSVLNQEFRTQNTHPLVYGYERTVFEKERLKLLIAEAEPLEFLTVKNRLKHWKAQLQRLEKTEIRFKTLLQELESTPPNRISVF